MRLYVLLLVTCLPLAIAQQPGGFTPADAAKRAKPADGLIVSRFASEPEVRQPIFVKCDDRGRVWTIQYLQYPNPAGLKRVKVDRWSRTVYDRTPDPPPKGPKGDDRITICEDTDGDGKADKFTNFVTGLNLCTGVEFGHGGVFVLQVPYLLFYPDRNHDDVPDADPEVLLSGFGMEDAQSLANHLTWGPDGWLYGLNGSTTTCRIRGLEFQQGVWRYHPITKEFELFCEGGGNVFGLTFDDHGNLFYSSNLGLFWHAHQGAYYFKNLGKHGPLHNPYAYGWLNHVAHDAATGGPTTGGTIYRGDTFPERFRGRFLAGDFLRHTASSWDVKPSGATVTATFRELLLDSRDTWFGATDLCLGPDGSIYLSDFYDKRTAHPDPDADWDRSNGRIYKIAATGTKPAAKFDLTKLTAKQLVELLKHPNGWFADRARVLLAERRDKTVSPDLRAMAHQNDTRLALRGLWALSVSGGFDTDAAAELLKHPSEHVRAWVVRLLGDAKKTALAKSLAELAATDPSPVVRAQLLCTAKRLPGEQAWPIIERLILRNADATDPVIPWLTWWAIESKAMSDRDKVTTFFTNRDHHANPAVKDNLARLVRRYAAEGRTDAYTSAQALVVTTLGNDWKSPFENLERGLAERAVALPAVGQGGLFQKLAPPEANPVRPAPAFDPLPEDFRLLICFLWMHSPSEPVLTRIALRASPGLARAVRDRVHQDLADPNTLRSLFRERLDLLEEFGDATTVPVVLPLLKSTDTDVQKHALTVLARIGGAEVGSAIVKSYPMLPDALKTKSREILFTRKEWAKAFLALVEARTIPAAQVPLEQVRLVALLGDASLDAIVRKHWGTVKPGTPEEKLAEIRRFSNDLRAATGDADAGKALFTKHCGTCHKLFGEGGSVGPDLTNTSRSDTAWLLATIVDPSAVIRSQYVQYLTRTTDEAISTGILAEQDGASVTLIDATGKKTRIVRDRLDSLRELPTSLMPEKLLDGLTPQERRDLFRYLQHSP